MGQGFDVDTAALARLAGDLDEAGRALYRRRTDLDASPDAGRSSGETSRALSGLASAVAGVAEHLGSMSDALRTTASTYDDADAGSHRRFGALR